MRGIRWFQIVSIVLLAFLLVPLSEAVRKLGFRNERRFKFKEEAAIIGVKEQS